MGPVPITHAPAHPGSGTSRSCLLLSIRSWTVSIYGVVEAGCKVVVDTRLKRAGMHWTAYASNTIVACATAPLRRSSAAERLRRRRWPLNRGTSASGRRYTNRVHSRRRWRSWCWRPGLGADLCAGGQNRGVQPPREHGLDGRRADVESRRATHWIDMAAAPALPTWA